MSGAAVIIANRRSTLTGLISRGISSFQHLLTPGLGALSLISGLVCLYKAYLEGPPQLYLPLDTEWQKAWQAEVSSGSSLPQEVVVEVSGAVEKPGVFTLSSASRVQDAVLQAGGFLAQADQKYIHQDLILAAKLTDQQKIYIPYLDEQEKTAAKESSRRLIPGGSSLNQVTQEQLESISGIGEVKAKQVLDGIPYSDEQDFRDRAGLSEKLVQEVLNLYSL